jgi:predicted nuclease with TOPRIM domain
MQEESEKFQQVSTERAQLRNQVRELQASVMDFEVRQALWDNEKTRREQHCQWLETELQSRSDELAQLKQERVCTTTTTTTAAALQVCCYHQALY